MFYYKAPDNSLYALEDNAFTHLLPDGCTELTEQEYQSLLPPPPPPAPLAATPYQLRAALNKQGLRQQVEAAVATSTDQNIKDAWQFAQTFVENDSFVVAIAMQLGQTTAQIHALFELAQTLNP